MPVCEYCDKPIEAGVTQCPYCFAPVDPEAASQHPSPPEPASTSYDAASEQPQQAPPPQPPPPKQPPPPAPHGDATGSNPVAVSNSDSSAGGIGDVLQSLQQGDTSGVAKGLQGMAQSGQLDVGKLASDLGVGGGQGLDINSVAKSLTGGGQGASSVLSALGNQGGGMGDVFQKAAGALKGSGGLAVGAGALAAGAGLLASRSGGGGGIGQALGSILGGGGQGATGLQGQLGALMGGENSGASPETAAQSQMAEQLPVPTIEQLSEGATVLARWDGSEWRQAKIGWIDNGQARVTFDSGLERWCDLPDLRLMPEVGAEQPASSTSAPNMAPPPPPDMAPPPPPDMAPPPPPAGAALPAVGTRVNVEVGDNLWAPAEVLDSDVPGARLYIRFDNNYECWMEMAKIQPLRG